MVCDHCTDPWRWQVGSQRAGLIPSRFAGDGLREGKQFSDILGNTRNKKNVPVHPMAPPWLWGARGLPVLL